MSAIIESLCFSFVILVSFATLFSVTDAVRFNVGGDGVWVINPNENYNTWAQRNRFQVNDTLYFKYAKGSDSVQQVMKADYDYCNTGNPLKKFDDGESVFMFDRSGPFYFISGNEDHCKKGQKLIVVVLAIRNLPTVPISPAKPPKSASAPVSPPSQSQPPKSSFSPALSPKATSPVSHSPSQAPSPSSKSPSPVSHSPALSPSHAPAPSSKSPSPVSQSPSQAPYPSSKSPSPVSHSPKQSPTESPVTPSPQPKSPSPASSPSPSSSSPDQSSTSSPADQTPTSSPSPSEANTSPDTATAPAPSSRNSANGVAVTSVMTAVLRLVFTVLMLV